MFTLHLVSAPPSTRSPCAIHTRHLDPFLLPPHAAPIFCPVQVDGCYADSSTFNVTYPQLGAALNATGRPIIYSCSWPAYLPHPQPPPYDQMARHCNLWRNFDDISDSWASVTVSSRQGPSALLHALMGESGWVDVAHRLPTVRLPLSAFLPTYLPACVLTYTPSCAMALAAAAPAVHHELLGRGGRGPGVGRGAGPLERPRHARHRGLRTQP